MVLLESCTGEPEASRTSELAAPGAVAEVAVFRTVKHEAARRRWQRQLSTAGHTSMAVVYIHRRRFAAAGLLAWVDGATAADSRRRAEDNSRICTVYGCLC